MSALGRALVRCVAGLSLAALAAAQEGEGERRVELEVERAGPGQVATVDGGSAAGLSVGDVVLFPVAGGEERRGEVVRLDEESATVRLDGRGPLPEPGSSATALVPEARAVDAQRDPPPPQETERVLDLRVSESGPGARVVVDRGGADGLQVEDRVPLAPRGSAERAGRVVEITQRSAVVELDDGEDAPPPGTRGEVRVPVERLPGAPVGETPPPPEPEPAPELAPEAAPAPAPEPRTVELRASSVGPGKVAVVDRGAADGLREGDRVRLWTARGEETGGVVVQLGNKTAVIELDPERPTPAAGARGEALLPAERFAAAPAPEARPSSPWENADEGYTSDMPLLTQVKAVRPEERPVQLSGFGYASGYHRFTGDGDRSDSFYRTGGGFRLENPFGEGGRVMFDAELNYRTTSLPDEAGEDTLRLRLDRLSYANGGDRFTPSRWEVGRFLQHGMPEFGILDGFEWGTRRANGHRFGASVGFLPEASPSMSTGQDLQLAAWYELVAGDREDLRLAAGYQKTFHDGDADRDLFLARFEYLPLDAWDLRATAWVDFYGDGSTAKGAGPDFTEAWVQTGRTWDSGNGLQLAYRHLETPELKANQVAPITAATLADGHYDRLSASGWRWLGRDQRLFGELGGWIDELDDGGDAELGIELREIFLDRARADLAVFGSQGRYSQVAGVRVLYGRAVENGWWDLLYEFSFQRQEGFTGDFGDVYQHRARASRDFELSRVWRLSLYAEGSIFDDEGALALGFFLQRSF